MVSTTTETTAPMTAMETRVERVEAAVETLTRAVDGLADAIVARVVSALSDGKLVPIVMTTLQLEMAVKAAMSASTQVANSASDERAHVANVVALQPAKENVGTAKATPSKKPKVKATKSLVIQPPPPPAPAAVVTKAVDSPAHTIESDMPSPTSLSLSMLELMTSFDQSMAHAPPPPPVHQHQQQQQMLPRQPQVTTYRPSAVPTKPTATVAPPAPQRPAAKRPHVVTPTQQHRQQQHQPQATASGNGRLYLWGNAWHSLPEDYEFPKQSLEAMWRQWCCGVGERGFQPLREIQASDIASSNNRKRLSDLKYLMKFIEQLLQDRGVWKDRPSEIEADQMLRAVREQLPFGTTGATGGKSGQKRDLDELKWHSAVTMLRTAHKKARTE